jgi:hypothetical protein
MGLNESSDWAREARTLTLSDSPASGRSGEPAH